MALLSWRAFPGLLPRFASANSWASLHHCLDLQSGLKGIHWQNFKLGSGLFGWLLQLLFGYHDQQLAEFCTDFIRNLHAWEDEQGVLDYQELGWWWLSKTNNADGERSCGQVVRQNDARQKLRLPPVHAQHSRCNLLFLWWLRTDKQHDALVTIEPQNWWRRKQRLLRASF